MSKRLVILFILYCAFIKIINAQDTGTVRGVLEYKGNPCTSIPCFPGLVLYLVQDSNSYVISNNGSWIEEGPLVWNSNEFFASDSITIVGDVYHLIDSLELIYL